MFERLLTLSNDVGLFAEEYDPRRKRMLGNFPQALTHMALVNTARLLSMPEHEARIAAAKGDRPSAVASRTADAPVWDMTVTRSLCAPTDAAGALSHSSD